MSAGRNSSLFLGALLALISLGCGPEFTEAVGPTSTGTLPPADLRILFVGNSLTYTNNLPGMVETVAEAAGKIVETTSVARPNYSLEDHWRSGIGQVIRELEPDLVIMQQGPSSLIENQAYLKDWAETLSGAIREAGGEPALLMVWPDDSRIFAFSAVYQSYENAALAVEGLFIPAGEAFRRAQVEQGWSAYGPDGFHPSRFGTIVVALSVVRSLYPEALENLPKRMVPTDSLNPTIDLGFSANLVYEMVESVFTAE